MGLNGRKELTKATRMEAVAEIRHGVLALEAVPHGVVVPLAMVVLGVSSHRLGTTLLSTASLRTIRSLTTAVTLRRGGTPRGAAGATPTKDTVRTTVGAATTKAATTARAMTRAATTKAATVITKKKVATTGELTTKIAPTRATVAAMTEAMTVVIGLIVIIAVRSLMTRVMNEAT